MNVIEGLTYENKRKKIDDAENEKRYIQLKTTLYEISIKAKAHSLYQHLNKITAFQTVTTNLEDDGLLYALKSQYEDIKVKRKAFLPAEFYDDDMLRCGILPAIILIYLNKSGDIDKNGIKALKGKPLGTTKEKLKMYSIMDPFRFSSSMQDGVQKIVKGFDDMVLSIMNNTQMTKETEIDAGKKTHTNKTSTGFLLDFEFEDDYDIPQIKMDLIRKYKKYFNDVVTNNANAYVNQLSLLYFLLTRENDAVKAIKDEKKQLLYMFITLMVLRYFTNFRFASDNNDPYLNNSDVGFKRNQIDDYLVCNMMQYRLVLCNKGLIYDQRISELKELLYRFFPRYVRIILGHSVELIISEITSNKLKEYKEKIPDNTWFVDIISTQEYEKYSKQVLSMFSFIIDNEYEFLDKGYDSDKDYKFYKKYASKVEAAIKSLDALEKFEKENGLETDELI